MHMYLDVMSDIVFFTWSFMVVMSEVGVLTSPGYSSRFPPAMSLVLWVSVFLGSDIAYRSHIWCPSILWFVLVEYKFDFISPRMLFPSLAETV